MHTVELLDRALRAVEGLGYRVRQEFLDGPGSACEIKGEKWLFLDVVSSPLDKLHVVADVLAHEVSLRREQLDPALGRFLDTRHAA